MTNGDIVDNEEGVTGNVGVNDKVVFGNAIDVDSVKFVIFDGEEVVSKEIVENTTLVVNDVFVIFVDKILLVWTIEFVDNTVGIVDNIDEDVDNNDEDVDSTVGIVDNIDEDLDSTVGIVGNTDEFVENNDEIVDNVIGLVGNTAEDVVGTGGIVS